MAVLIRIGVAAAMAVAASAVVFGGQASAKFDGCSSPQPKWNYQCIAAGSNVSLGSCLKDGPNWHPQFECAARDDNSGRYDLWIPAG